MNNAIWLFRLWGIVNNPIIQSRVAAIIIENEAAQWRESQRLVSRVTPADAAKHDKRNTRCCPVTYWRRLPTELNSGALIVINLVVVAGIVKLLTAGGLRSLPPSIPQQHTHLCRRLRGAQSQLSGWKNCTLILWSGTTRLDWKEGRFYNDRIWMYKVNTKSALTLPYLFFVMKIVHTNRL